LHNAIKLNYVIDLIDENLTKCVGLVQSGHH